MNSIPSQFQENARNHIGCDGEGSNTVTWYVSSAFGQDAYLYKTDKLTAENYLTREQMQRDIDSGKNIRVCVVDEEDGLAVYLYCVPIAYAVSVCCIAMPTGSNGGVFCTQFTLAEA